jgi:hypothetical protein
VRSLALLLLALPLACSKVAKRDESSSAPPAPLKPAPQGVLVTRVLGKCATLPCPMGDCAVTCPQQLEMLRVDITEPLLGRIAVFIDNAEVASLNVPAMPTTGLAYSIGVRPLRWPVQVEVRVNEHSAKADIDQLKPFVKTNARTPGPFTLLARAEPFFYD